MTLARLPRRTAAALLLGTLAACDTPLTELHPPTRIATTDYGRWVVMEARFDPFQGAYFAEVRAVHGRTEPVGRADAVRLVEEVLGPEVCSGAPLAVGESGAWGFTGGAVSPNVPAVPLDSVGGWRLIARCA